MEFTLESQSSRKSRPSQRHGEAAGPRADPPHPGVELQQRVGNQAMQQLLRNRTIHAKLDVSQPGDPDEQEADAVAARVMRSHAGSEAAASSCSCDDEEDEMCDECSQKAAVSRKASDAGGTPSRHGHAAIGSILRSPGQALDSGARAFFEPRFGRDFSNVRVHTDEAAAASANSIQAHAYAAGDHLVFNTGRFAPETEEGRKLLAHELAHTIQQTSGGETIQRQPQEGVSSPSSVPAEPAAPDSSMGGMTAQWPYPAIAAALPPEVVALRASASLQLPLSIMLRPDLHFDDRDIWDEYLANRRQKGSDEEAAALLRNEMLRRYFQTGVQPSEKVEVDVTPALDPGDSPTVEFFLRGKPIQTPDGMIGAQELALIAPIDGVLQTVQRDAGVAELAGQLLDALDELEPAVEDLKRVHDEPEDFALYKVLAIRYSVQQAGKAADDWSCRVGPAIAATANLAARYAAMEATANNAATFLNQWHSTNTMESMGQANVRRGKETSHPSVRVLWGILDVGENLLSLGDHTARTEISEAYEAGTISMNEAEELVSKADIRALLSAVALREGGLLGRGAGVGVASTLELTGTGARLVGGAFAGATSAAAMMATQNLITSFSGSNLSSAGQQIWNAGAPGAKQWGVGLLFGALQGAGRSLNPESAAPDMNSAPENSPAAGEPAQQPGFQGPRSGVLGMMQRMALWGPLRFVDPAMRGVGETSVELTSGASSVPSETAGGMSSPASEAPVSSPAPAENSPAEAPGEATPAPSATQATSGISLGFRPIIQLPSDATPEVAGPAASPFSAQQLTAIPGITAAEVQALQRVTADGWSSLLAYARTNSNEYSVKGKIGEAVYLSGSAAAAKQQRASQTADRLNIQASEVRFTTDVRGQTATRTSSGGTGELTDGIFYAIHNGKLYILEIIEAKSRSNKAELAHKVVDDEREFLGQLAWDFERMRELPITVDGRTFSPDQVVVSRRFTRFTGVLPQGQSLSQESLRKINEQLTNIDIENVDVRDAVLNQLARMLIAVSRGS
jgi:hypothetical protein